MKNLVTFALILLVTIGFVSCDKLKSLDYKPSNIEFSFDTVRAAGDYIKFTSQKYDVNQIFKSLGISADKVKGLNLKKIDLTMLTPGVYFSDFSKAQMEVYAKGLDTVRIGWVDNIPASATTALSLNVATNTNILEYANSGEVFFKLTVTATKPLPAFRIKAERAEVFPASISKLGF